jgi:ORF6N domain
MSSRKKPFALTRLEPLIVTIRGHRVILDADLAKLYEVPTFRFNEAFKRNRHRFPDDFAFQLTAKEFSDLRSYIETSRVKGIVDSANTENSSQFAISSSQESHVLNRSQFVTSSSRHRGKAYRPWAFTEHGAVMAANILRSERAVHMSVFVVRAFVRLREHVVANQAILKRLAEIDRTLLQHDSSLLDLYEKLLPLLQPPPAHPKRRIGFQPKGKP